MKVLKCENVRFLALDFCCSYKKKEIIYYVCILPTLLKKKARL